MVKYYYSKYTAAYSPITDPFVLLTGNWNSHQFTNGVSSILVADNIQYSSDGTISLVNPKTVQLPYPRSADNYISRLYTEIGYQHTNPVYIKGNDKATTIYRATPEFVRRYVNGTYDYVYIHPEGKISAKSPDKISSTNLSVRKGILVESNIAAEDGTYPINGLHTDGFYYVREVQVNSIPIASLQSPINAATLYENDTLNITGTVSDADNGNTVTVRYQINANTVRAIKAFVSNGTTAESFSKQLRFSGGNLYDGDTLIASNLTDGVPHSLKIWATDDQGGSSTIVERTFYVVPNRAPALSVNTPVISGNIDNDEIEVTGSFNDLDKNTTKVSYRINGGSSVQVAEGTGGDFNFKVKFGQLKVGLNSIVVEAIDSYGAKTSRTVKLNKNEVKTEQLKSTARFKIHPPLNTAKGIVLWVRRDENLALSASISMTQAAEAESFVQMEKPRTAPLANTPGVVEDQFEYESESAADKIILQLDMQRSSLTANEKIYLLVGVID